MSNRFFHQRLRSGFTLVEILIALAILAIIVASTFTIFRSSSSSWQKGEKRSEKYHNARVAIGKMSMEISHAVIAEGSDGKFIGDKQGVRFISFVSASSGIFEVAEIGYWLDKDKRALMRNEDIDPDYDFSTQDYSDILADNDTWDSDTSAEEEEKDKYEKALPEAVKIKIEIEDKQNKEGESFEVITRLKTV